MIKFEIIPDEEYAFDFSIAYLSRKMAKKIFEIEKLKFSFSFNILLVSKSKIKKINKSRRKIDKITDVLSFPNIEYNKPSNFKPYIMHDSINPKIYDFTTNTIFLGDIIICYDVLIKQAQLYGHSIKREYAFLLTHAILHLLGYDHIVLEDRIKMFKKQDIVLNELKIFR